MRYRSLGLSLVILCTAASGACVHLAPDANSRAEPGPPRAEAEPLRPFSPPPVDETTRPAAGSHPILRIHQGQCQGECPVYMVTLWSDGRIDSNGKLHVARKGAAHATIPLDQVAAIAKAFAAARYFDLDDDGDLPVPLTTCVKQPDGTETCSGGGGYAVACSDTPHTTVTYVDGDRTRTMDDPLRRRRHRALAARGRGRADAASRRVDRRGYEVAPRDRTTWYAGRRGHWAT